MVIFGEQVEESVEIYMGEYGRGRTFYEHNNTHPTALTFPNFLPIDDTIKTRLNHSNTVDNPWETQGKDVAKISNKFPT